MLAASALSARLRTLLPKGFEVTDWTQDNATYFRATRIERTMMSLILFLIVAVAAFNIVAMLVMVVTDKRTDIAILRTFGASPGRSSASSSRRGWSSAGSVSLWGWRSAS